MDIIDGLVGWPALIVGWLAWLPTLAWALARQPWRALASGERLHVYLGATVVVLTLWMIRAGVDAGLNLHLLAVTSLTLMFGGPMAVVSVSAVLLLTTLNGAAGWTALGLNFLVMGAGPILLTQVLLRLAQRFLPLNFFVYIFVNAFLCGGLSVLLAGAASAALLNAFGPYDAAHLLDHYLGFYALMFFPEAVFNGMVMTLIVAYRPGWCRSFTDRLYLGDR